MIKRKFTKVTAIGVIAMGIIHIIATFTPLITKGLDVLPIGKQHAITYFSLMCGTLLIFGGVLIFLLNDKVKEHSFLQFPYNLTKYVILLSGILAVAFMTTNPFAWLILAIAILLVFSK